MLNHLLIIILLIVVSAFFSISEISLAASRKIRLKPLADAGNLNARRVLKMQENPGVFFTVVQIGVNAVAILAGIFSEATFSPLFHHLLAPFFPAGLAANIAAVLSFVVITGLFILLADLIPKRFAIIAPEATALRTIQAMRFCLMVFQPLIWLFNGLANILFRLLKLPNTRKEDITPDDIYAVMEAGALAGVLRQQEREIIGNVFELESRTVPSAMTGRENVIWLDLHADEHNIKTTIAHHPHSRFLVCDGQIDQLVGYVDSKDLLNQLLSQQTLTLLSGVQLRNALIVPDSLTLSEALDRFKSTGEHFAVIMNEYALVVGIISLNDVMTTLMGDVVNLGLEEQIICRDAHSWLMEGATPIDDVMRVLDINGFPQQEGYETIGGFMMFMLRKIPKRTDAVNYAGYKFEVVDIDNHRIDQLLVTRIVTSDADNNATGSSCLTVT